MFLDDTNPLFDETGRILADIVRRCSFRLTQFEVLVSVANLLTPRHRPPNDTIIEVSDKTTDEMTDRVVFRSFFVQPVASPDGGATEAESMARRSRSSKDRRTDARNGKRGTHTPDLDDYRDKRDFGRTPEPVPGRQDLTDIGHAFVIHRHDASHLHYDLRLEMNGVLESWAVPRGLSCRPGDKRMAVRTEAHPMEYLEFEGIIPKGQYGAGSMTIFDYGTFAFRDGSGIDGVEDGKLEIELRGRRFRGEWHMVRTKGETGREWLLFKARDRFARDDDSVPPGDLERARLGRPPKSFRRMEPDAVRRENDTRASSKSDLVPFDDPDWIFEAAFAGERVSVRKDGDDIRITAGRRRLDGSLPEVVRDVTHLGIDHAVMDGVLVVRDDGGRPSAGLLADRLAGRSDDDAQLYLFDIPFLEEWDLRRVPLRERKARLRFAVPAMHNVLFLDHVAARGIELAEVVSAGGLTGMWARRAESVYRAGSTKDWRTIVVHPETTTSSQSIEDALGERRTDIPPRIAGLTFSNLEKVFWPDEGYTKGDLVRYYDQIADYLVPYLVDRPLHLRRMPNGIDGDAFYQRRAPDHAPDWLEVVDVFDSEGILERQMIARDRRSILYLANLASIDLHPWLSREPNLDEPTWAVFDLDPKEAPFSDVIKVARAVGKVLQGIDVTFGLKTSGKTGLHVFVPVAPGYGYEHVRMFCEGVARVVVRDHPSIATVARNPGRRGGRVYIDFLQNVRGQTVVPPYVVRPVPHACVSTPIRWDELDSRLEPSMFTIENVPTRVAEIGDLFAQLGDAPVDLVTAAEALEHYVRR